ncbi:MAG: FAD-dependent thymidylate synthase, partial [Nitriliruptoraceae bacterium]
GFRDLQRHRMCTIEWQDLTVAHGYDTPDEVEEAGLGPSWHDAIARAADLYRDLRVDLPDAAQYAVPFASRIRWTIQLNARAAMQMLELRSQPQGHPQYRRIVQDMHRAIRDGAGHTAGADAMVHVDHGAGDRERLGAERAREARRAARRPGPEGSGQ